MVPINTSKAEFKEQARRYVKNHIANLSDQLPTKLVPYREIRPNRGPNTIKNSFEG